MRAGAVRRVNVSVWETLENAKQTDAFGPTIELGKQFAEMGARFERPIVNYETLWQIEPQ